MISSPNHEIKVPEGMEFINHRVEGQYMVVVFRSLKPRTVQTPKGDWVSRRVAWDFVRVYYDAVGHECFRATDERKQKLEPQVMPLPWWAVWRRLNRFFEMGVD